MVKLAAGSTLADLQAQLEVEMKKPKEKPKKVVEEEPARDDNFVFSPGKNIETFLLQLTPSD